MPGYINGVNPELIQQALTATGSNYQLPVPAIDSNAEPLPQQGGQPVVQQPIDLGTPEAPGGASPQSPIGQANQNMGQAPQPSEMASPGQDLGIQEVAPMEQAPQKTVTLDDPTDIQTQMTNEFNSLNTNTEDRIQGTKEQLEAEAAGAQQTAEAYKQQADFANRALSKHDEHQAAMDTAYNDVMSRYRSINADMEKMDAPHDRRTKFQRTAGVLGVALGGIADHFAMVGGGQSNNAEQIQKAVDNNIERDLNEQREAIAFKQKKGESVVNELSLARQHFGDTMDADKYARALVQDRTAATISQIAAGTTNASSAGKLKILAGQMRQEATAQKLDVLKSMFHAKMTATPDGARAMRGNGKVPDNRTPGQKGGDDKESGEASLPGYIMTQESRWYTSERTKRASELAASAQGVIGLGNLLADKFDSILSAKTEKDATQARTDYITGRESYLSAISIALEQGVITKSDALRMEGAVPPSPPANLYDKARQAVTQWWDGKEYSSRSIRSYGNTLKKLTDSKLQTLGYNPEEQPRPIRKWTPP